MLKGLSACCGYQTDWRSLDDRLLRDIGKSPVDVEVGRIKRLNGGGRDYISDAMACRGVGCKQFGQWMKRDCYRMVG